MKAFYLSVIVVFVMSTNVSLAQWINTRGPYLNGDVYAVAVGDSLLVAGTYGQGIFVSTDNGLSWTPSAIASDNKYFTCVAFAGSNIIAGNQLAGGIYLSTDDGASWSQDYSTGYRGVLCFGVHGSIVYAGGSYLALRSTDDGVTWSDMGNPLKAYDVDGFAFDDSDVFAGCSNEGVFRSTDDGLTWSLTSNLNWDGVSAVATLGRKLFAATSTGLYVSTDKGDHWTADSGITDGNIDCIVTKGSEICVGSWQGGVYVSSDSGATWTQTNLYKNNPYVYSVVIKDSTIVAGTRFGGVYESNDKGKSWVEHRCTDRSIPVPALAFEGSELIACTTGGLVCVSTDGGESWAERLNGLQGLNATGIAVDGSDIYVQAAGGFYGLYASTDNCVSWSQFGSAQELLGVQDLVGQCKEVNGGMNNGLATTLAEWASWTQYTHGLSNTNIRGLTVNGSNIFAGTWGGGIFQSSNEGLNWSQANKGLTYLGVSSVVSSGSDIFAGTFDGGVFISTDNGADWTQTNDGMKNTNIHSLATIGGYLFAGTDSGDYVSASDGLSWTYVGLDSDTTYTFIPGDSNVYAGTYTGIFHRPLSSIADLFPSRGSLFSPVSDSSGLPDSVDLVWNSIPKAISYRVQVAYDGGFTHLILNRRSVNDTSFMLTNLKPDTTYSWRVSAQDSIALGSWSPVWNFNTGNVTSVRDAQIEPKTFGLSQNYPNPFNPTTVISFGVPSSGLVSLKVYDVLGRLVRTLVNRVENPGTHRVTFNAADLPSGVYFYRLRAGSFSKTMKLMVIK